eukprot:GHVS01059904.1.p1 GENE.GHVS01059904.1~~GHVS01059904.1.p1  ORF type:complete len:301 (-),score=50.58 GHVS01059904.1:223-1125(-)
MENRQVRANVALPKERCHKRGAAHRGGKEASELRELKAARQAHKATLERARQVHDVFQDMAAFQHYERNGLNVRLKHVSVNQLMSGVTGAERAVVRVAEAAKEGQGEGKEEKDNGIGIVRKVFDLTRRNMQEVYDKTNFDDNGWNDETKWNELTHPDAQFLLAFASRQDLKGDESCFSVASTTEDKESLAGFMHFRFETDEDNPCSSKDAVVAYIWDVQLDQWAQRKGLGKHLMNVVELTGKKVGINKLMCTVLKENADAMRFYRGKCKFVMDESSPDMFLELDDDELCEYDILKKDLKK